TFGRINLKNARFTEDFGPIDPECACWACRSSTAAYLRHLYKSDEILAARLLTYHNLSFYHRLMAGIRDALEADRFPEFRRDFLSTYSSGASGARNLARRACACPFGTTSPADRARIG